MQSTTGWALSGRAHISHSQKALVLFLSFGLNHYCIGHCNAEHSKRTEHVHPPILVGCLAGHDGFIAVRRIGEGGGGPAGVTATWWQVCECHHLSIYLSVCVSLRNMTGLEIERTHVSRLKV